MSDAGVRNRRSQVIAAVLIIIGAASLLGLASPASAEIEEALAALRSGDHAAAYSELLLLAKDGDPAAQNNLGVMFDNALGVPRDHAKAVKWYRLASDQGYAAAQHNIGVSYMSGTGVPQDYVEAEIWYLLAAMQRYTLAEYNLGILYYNGYGQPPDHAFAAKWFREAAEKGYAPAQHNLGLMYRHGDGVTRDFVMAYVWSDLAASRLPPGEHHDQAVKNRATAGAYLTLGELAEARRLAREWKPKLPKRLATGPRSSAR